MSALEVGEVVVAAGLLVLVTTVVLLVLRRRAVAGGYPLSLAAVRPTSGRGRWRLGLLRLGPTALAWYPVVSATTRPSYVWDRATVEVSTPTGEDVSVPGLADPVQVDLRTEAAGTCPLAVERGVYMAIRSWLESAPPGQDVNVA